MRESFSASSRERAAIWRRSSSFEQLDLAVLRLEELHALAELDVQLVGALQREEVLARERHRLIERDPHDAEACRADAAGRLALTEPREDVGQPEQHRRRPRERDEVDHRRRRSRSRAGAAR